MSRPPPSWEDLNAYVDGELSDHDRANVAAAVAREPKLAGVVAALSRLKSAAGESVEKSEFAAPLPRPASRRLAIAACLFALVVAGAALLAFWPSPDSEPSRLAELAAAHDSWSADSVSPPPQGDAGTVLVALSTLGPRAYIPDLAASRLSLGGATFRPASARRPPLLHLLYRGERGCRVSLWITSAPHDLRPGLREARHGDVLAFTWPLDGLAYTMLSRMNETRFRLIVTTAYRSTLEQSRPDRESEMALRRSREQSPPCPA